MRQLRSKTAREGLAELKSEQGKVRWKIPFLSELEDVFLFPLSSSTFFSLPLDLSQTLVCSVLYHSLQLSPDVGATGPSAPGIRDGGDIAWPPV